MLAKEDVIHAQDDGRKILAPRAFLSAAGFVRVEDGARARSAHPGRESHPTISLGMDELILGMDEIVLLVESPKTAPR